MLACAPAGFPPLAGLGRCSLRPSLACGGTFNLLCPVFTDPSFPDTFHSFCHNKMFQIHLVLCPQPRDQPWVPLSRGWCLEVRIWELGALCCGDVSFPAPDSRQSEGTDGQMDGWTDGQVCAHHLGVCAHSVWMGIELHESRQAPSFSPRPRSFLS